MAQTCAARPPVVIKDPRGLTAISALPAAFDRAQASAAWVGAGIPTALHDQLWSTFCAGELFAPDDDDAWWARRGWREARAYHDATRDYPFLQMDRPDAFVADAQRMKSYAGTGVAPRVYQSLGEAAVALPRIPEDGEAPDAWLDRAGQAAGDKERIGFLLDLCFGERGRITIADGSTCLVKNVPSGGARHPTEVFLAAFDLDGVPAGVHHYDVEHHRLDAVRPGQHRDALAAASLDLFSRLGTPPAAALVFTSLVERAMWRYRDPRSFRAILVDVGHAVSAYRRVARRLGYRTLAYQKFSDEAVAELVGVDPVRQPPLYIGTLVR